MADIEGNQRKLPREGNGDSITGSSPGVSKKISSHWQEPILKNDLYTDLQKIEARGKRKKGLSFFVRNKK